MRISSFIVSWTRVTTWEGSMGKPIWVDSVTRGKLVRMGYTDGNTLTCYKKASDKLYSMGNRVALDDGGLHQAKGRDVTRVIIIIDGEEYMDNYLTQWMSGKLVRLGYGDKKEHPQRTLGPQDVDTTEAALCEIARQWIYDAKEGQF